LFTVILDDLSGNASACDLIWSVAWLHIVGTDASGRSMTTIVKRLPLPIPGGAGLPWQETGAVPVMGGAVVVAGSAAVLDMTRKLATAKKIAGSMVAKFLTGVTI
jgi:hypothetical protein